MLEQEAKQWIAREVKGILEPELRVGDAIEAFEQLVLLDANLDVVEGFKSPEFIHLLNTLHTLSPMDLANQLEAISKVEQLMKKLLYIADPKKYMAGAPQGKTSYQGNTTRDKTKTWTINTLYEYGFQIKQGNKAMQPRYQRCLRYYIYVQDIRNKKGHSFLSQPAGKNYEALTNILVVYLHLSYQYRDIIRAKYDEGRRKKEFDARQYAKGIVDSYLEAERLGFTYVHVKWTPQAQRGIRQNDGDQPQQQTAPVEKLRTAMAGERRMRLLGEAGTGKTTALNYLEYLDAQAILAESGTAQHPVPVLLKMIDFTQSGQTIRNELCAHLGISPEACENYLRYGLVNLYLDGFNEVLDIDLKKTLAQELENLMKSYPKVFFIITDRDIARSIVRVAPAVKPFILHPMDGQDIEEFVGGNATRPETRQIILDFYGAKPAYFADITPIRLRQLLSIVDETGQVPTNIDDEYIEHILRREQEEKLDENVHYLRYFLASLLLLDEPYSTTQILAQFAKVKNSMGFGQQVDAPTCLLLAERLGILREEESSRAGDSPNPQYSFARESYGFHFEELASELIDVLQDGAGGEV